MESFFPLSLLGTFPMRERERERRRQRERETDRERQRYFAGRNIGCIGIRLSDRVSVAGRRKLIRAIPFFKSPDRRHKVHKKMINKTFQ